VAAWTHVRSQSPPFWNALIADSGLAAGYRSERWVFRSKGRCARAGTAAHVGERRALGSVLVPLKARLQALGVLALPRLAHRSAMMTAQVCDPVSIRTGIYLVYESSVMSSADALGVPQDPFRQTRVNALRSWTLVSTVETSETTAWAKMSRRLLARHIVGSGLELGPGHVPFLVGPGTSIRVVDRWQPEENQELFAELEDAEFAEPDIVADLNTDRLQSVPDASQDFVICSHVLEHVAEPIGLLADIHRVLRPGGVVLMLLPDRHRTFDRYRNGTSLAHLVDEYESGVTEVNDEHIIEFLSPCIPIGNSAEERRETLDLHRRRSVHVHCWDDQEFLPVLLYGIEHLGWLWQFVDGMVTDDEGVTGVEFGFVLRVCTAELTGAVLRERLDTTWQVWREARLSLLDSLRNAKEATAARQARLERIDRSLPMRLYHFGKRVTRL
jgi:SAM-dependent methyltransferase